MGAIASQITSLTIVYSTVYSDADQRKHQSSALLAFVRGIHRGPVNSPHKWPVARKMFPFDDAIMNLYLGCVYVHLIWNYNVSDSDCCVIIHVYFMYEVNVVVENSSHMFGRTRYEMFSFSSNSDFMMTSSNGNIFRVTGPLCGEFTGHRWISLTTASDAELWCFLWSAPEQTIEQTLETPVIWDVSALIMTSPYCIICYNHTTCSTVWNIMLHCTAL